MNDSNHQFGLLRLIRPEELMLMLEWRNAPSVRENMYTRHEISITEHLEWWARIEKRTDQSYFMYEFQEVPMGIVAFTATDSVNGNSSWAFYASPIAPKGTGSRMEFLALEHAFERMGLHKLHCEVLAFNVAVVKLHQKFGFKVEGVLREQHRVEEKFVDVYRLGILESEWETSRENMQQKLLKYSTS